jgi:hypothetical protein
VRLKPLFVAAGLWDDTYLTSRHAWLFAVSSCCGRAPRLDDFVGQGRFFLDTVEYDRPPSVSTRRNGGASARRRGDWPRSSISNRSIEARCGRWRTPRVKAATLIHGIR